MPDYCQFLINITKQKALYIALVFASILTIALVGYTKKHDFDVKYCFDGVHIRVQNLFECPKRGSEVDDDALQRDIASAAMMKCANADKNLKMVELDSGYYYFSGGLTHNWYDALKFCNSRGLELVSIETDQENANVTTYSRSKAADSKDKSHWLSGNNLGDPNHWSWMSTGGSEMIQDEHNWHVDTLRGSKSDDNHDDNRCTCIFNKSGLFKWQPQNCNEKKSFICETPSFCLHLRLQQQQINSN